MNNEATFVSSTWSGPLTPPATVPDSADVVVIGGGIVGVSTAWFLARQGVSVVLCEKGHIAGEQSGRNWGWVRIQGRDRREIPMMQAAMEVWDGLQEATGEDVGFVRRGCFFTAGNETEMESFEQWIRTAAEYGIESRLVSAAELQKYVKGATGLVAGAVYTESDGRAEPQRAAPAIARAAEREGASVLTSCAVRANDRWQCVGSRDGAWHDPDIDGSLRGRCLDVAVLSFAWRRGAATQGAWHRRKNCSLRKCTGGQCLRSPSRHSKARRRWLHGCARLNIAAPDYTIDVSLEFQIFPRPYAGIESSALVIWQGVFRRVESAENLGA
jgi:hypothetical protein